MHEPVTHVGEGKQRARAGTLALVMVTHEARLIQGAATLTPHNVWQGHRLGCPYAQFGINTHSVPLEHPCQPASSVEPLVHEEDLHPPIDGEFDGTWGNHCRGSLTCASKNQTTMYRGS